MRTLLDLLHGIRLASASTAVVVATTAGKQKDNPDPVATAIVASTAVVRQPNSVVAAAAEQQKDDPDPVVVATSTV